MPVPGGAYFGRGLEDLGETVQKIQYGADKAELTRSTLDGQQEFKNILQESADSISNRDDFKEQATSRTNDAYQLIIGAASKRVRPLLESNLSNHLKAAQRNIEHHYWVMTKDKAAGDYTAAKDQLTRAAIGADEENQKGAGRMFGELVGDMMRSGYMKREKAAEELVDFNRKVEAESMNLEAAARPAQFIRKQQEGVYDGRDSTAVNRALEIASRVGDARARKDAAEMRMVSEAAERAYELAASEHRLDEADLRGAARYYGWDDNKVNGLIKMHTGLTAANPNELIVIRDAMKPVDGTAMYTMADIIKADRALGAAVKSGQADARTPEFTAAIRHLQSLRSSLNITADIQSRHSTYDARQAVQHIYRSFPVRATSKRERDAADAERNRTLREVTELPPSERRAYVDRLQKRLEKQSTATPTRNEVIDGLRSIPRR